MVRRALIVATAIALAGCTSTPMNPGGGGGNNPPPGGGGPTGPGPVATTGTIAGAVTSAGAGVGGARVTLGASAASTASSGQYTFADVAAGTQTVTLTVPGGRTLAAGETSAKNTTVTAGQTSTVNWTLAPAAATPQTADVSLLASSFFPSAVTIARGDTVRWTNVQPLPHTITPDNRNQSGAWPSENMSRGGATFSHVFTTEGTFNYSCLIHVGMTGVVTVR